MTWVITTTIGTYVTYASSESEAMTNFHKFRPGLSVIMCVRAVDF